MLRLTHRRYGRLYGLYLEGQAGGEEWFLLFEAEDEGTGILGNIGKYLPIDKALNPGKLHSAVTPLWTRIS